jgi:hypothetical protein
VVGGTGVAGAAVDFFGGEWVGERDGAAVGDERDGVASGLVGDVVEGAVLV